MAVSLADWKPIDFAQAAEVAAAICRVVLEQGLPEDTYLNVNIPYVDLRDICGVEITRLGKRIYRDAVEKKTDEKVEEFMEKIAELPSKVDLASAKPVGPFGMLSALSSKEARQGLGVLMQLTKAMGELKNGNGSAQETAPIA